jgi:Putative zinc-finger
MTECDNAEIRDLLPDYVAETLSASDLARVTMHLSECTPCQQEVALLRVARAVRPQAVHIDVAAIVARIGTPEQRAAAPHPVPIKLERSEPRSDIAPQIASNIAPNTAPNIAAPISIQRPARARRPMWQIAAMLGVVAVGGMSVVVAERGGFGLMNGGRADSVRAVAISDMAPSRDRGGNGDSVNAASATSVPAIGSAVTEVADASTTRASSRATLVSVGDLGDYTDAELQRMLDRIDKWDGATSSEVMPTLPIVPVPSGGTER